MGIEPVTAFRGACSDLVAERLTVANLPRDERRRLGLVHAQQKLGRGHRGEHRSLLVAVDSAQLGDALKAENGRQSMLAATGYQRLELRLTAKDGKLVHDDPDPSARVGVEQSANQEIEPEVGERKRRRVGIVPHRQEEPALSLLSPCERAPCKPSV